MSGIEKLQALPVATQVTIGVLLLVQIALMITALVVLARTQQPVKGLPRGVWLVVILLGQLLGPIIFLALAYLHNTGINAKKERNELAAVAPSTKEAPADDQRKANVSTTIDHLYGGQS